MLYGKVFVLPKLSERASVEFQPINAKLSDLMINMHPPQKMCSDYPYYSRLSISTSCSVDASSINVGLTEALKNNWQQKASLLDKELTSHGWESTDYEGHLKLQDLLTKDSYWVATYVKKTSQYECYIAIRFDVHDSQSEPLRVDESCYRFIHVFGGY